MDNIYPSGQCTYWVYQEVGFIQPYGNLGNAKDWPATARTKGLPEGTTPQVEVPVCFQPGVDGAGGYGHVAKVVSLDGNGGWTQSEMDFPNAGVVTTRHIGSVAPGVSFIYPPSGETELSSTEFTQLQTELDQQKQDYQSNITRLQQEFDNLRTDTQSEIQQLQTEINALKGSS